MANWHAAGWRTRTLGRVLRRQRKIAGLSVAELAQCLIGRGFAADEIADAQGRPDEARLAGHLKTIEAEGDWPFDDSVLEAFLRYAAACLAGRRGPQHEERTLRQLVRAVGDDHVDEFLDSTGD